MNGKKCNLNFLPQSQDWINTVILLCFFFFHYSFILPFPPCPPPFFSPNSLFFLFSPFFPFFLPFLFPLFPYPSPFISPFFPFSFSLFFLEFSSQGWILFSGKVRLYSPKISLFADSRRESEFHATKYLNGTLPNLKHLSIRGHWYMQYVNKIEFFFFIV